MSIFLIAEIGINHNGDLKIAKELINHAADAGFDAVKFQKRTIDKVYTKNWIVPEKVLGADQRDQNGLEFGQKEYEEIDNYCKN